MNDTIYDVVSFYFLSVGMTDLTFSGSSRENETSSYTFTISSYEFNAN